MPDSYPPNSQDAVGRLEDEDRLIARLPVRREMHLADAILIIRKKVGLITACVAFGLLFGMLATWLTHKRYSSTVTIEVHKDGGSSINLDDLSGISSQLVGGDQMSVDLLTQQTIIANDNIALKVIEDLSLASRAPFSSIPRKTPSIPVSPASLEDDPEFREGIVHLFQSRLKVTLVKGTRLIDVTYADQDPKLAAQVANEVVDAYVIESAQQRYDATSRTSNWLTNQLSDLKARVAKSQKEVSDFRQKAGLLGATTQGASQHGGAASLAYDNLELDRLGDLTRQLTGAEVAHISSEAIYRLTQSQNPDVFLGMESSQLASGTNGSSIFNSASQDIGLLRQLRTDQGRIKVELAANTTKYGGKNPVIVELRSQLTELNAQIAEEMHRVSVQAKNDLELAASTENSIRQTVDKEKLKIAQLNNSADQLLLLQQEETSNRTLYQDLYGKLEAANVIAGVKSSDVTIVNPARVPAYPSKPLPIQNAALGLLAGLVIGVFVAFATDHRNDTISTPQDVTSQTGQALVGIVPLFQESKIRQVLTGALGERADKSQQAAWVLRAPRSATAEAYRQIRTAVLLSRPSKPPKVVLFTSSLSGDGKTTTCFNTAFSFALQNSRVLMIDGDMRKPSLHIELGLKNENGLSQVLSSDIDPNSVIRPVGGLENMYLMTAGPVPPTPSELLGSQKFKDLLDKMRGEFDFIFVDGPPVLMVTDAVLITQVADAVVLVVRSAVTRLSFVRRVMELLGPTGRSKVLGVVLNAADLRSAEYRSAYGYYGDKTYYGDSNA